MNQERVPWTLTFGYFASELNPWIEGYGLTHTKNDVKTYHTCPPLHEYAAMSRSSDNSWQQYTPLQLFSSKRQYPVSLQILNEDEKPSNHVTTRSPIVTPFLKEMQLVGPPVQLFEPMIVCPKISRTADSLSTQVVAKKWLKSFN